jgi:integrase
LRLKPPKTKRGRRNIKLDADAVAVLRAHRLAQMQLRLVLGQGGQPTIVFSDIEGKHMRPNYVSRNWHKFIVTRKLRNVSFHALRHTHASISIRVGVDLLTLSRRLGHSSVKETLDTYGT